MFHDIKEVMDRTMNYVKLVSLQVRLPMFGNDIIDDFFGLILRETLIGFKWRELVKIIVEFDPPGAELTNRLITSVKEHMVAHINFLLGKWIVFGEHLFRNSMETFNMSVSCFFFLFRSFVIEDAKSLTLK
jgi:hypothetical protein